MKNTVNIRLSKQYPNLLDDERLYDKILSDNKDSYIVVGTNLAGIHGKGAALTAKTKYGLQQHVGQGISGRTYALPTKDFNIKPLSLIDINKNVLDFVWLAKETLDKTYLLTKIGCGLAGYKEHEIAPMFNNATTNIILPREWRGKYYVESSNDTWQLILHEEYKSYKIANGEMVLTK